MQLKEIRSVHLSVKVGPFILMKSACVGYPTSFVPLVTATNLASEIGSGKVGIGFGANAKSRNFCNPC